MGIDTCRGDDRYKHVEDLDFPRQRKRVISFAYKISGAESRGNDKRGRSDGAYPGAQLSYFRMSIYSCNWTTKLATAGMKLKVLKVLTTMVSTMVAPMTDPKPHMRPPIKFLAMILPHLVFSLASYRSRFIYVAYGVWGKYARWVARQEVILCAREAYSISDTERRQSSPLPRSEAFTPS